MSKKNAKPLSGVRVLEFCQIAAGPFVGSLLADLGADVVKVEKPMVGDGLRAWPPLTTGVSDGVFSENFASINRNKRSIIADFKNKHDVAHLKNLIAVCDVVIENYRPGVLPRLGLGYEDFKKIKTSLVYCSVSGFGQVGENSSKGAFDVTVQAFSGLMSVTGEPGGNPIKCGVPVGDFCAGLYAGYAILARLMQARETGQGAYIDCSMLGSLIGISALQTSEYFGTQKTPQALGSAHPRNAPYQAFRSKDDYFVIAAGNDLLWEKVADAVGLSDLVKDPRFKTQILRAQNQKDLVAILQPEFEKKPAQIWLQKLDDLGVPCSPINTFPEALKSNQVKSMDLVKTITLPNKTRTKTTAFPVKMTDFEFEIYRSPPSLGAHNEEVAEEWLKTQERLAD